MPCAATLPCAGKVTRNLRRRGAARHLARRTRACRFCISFSVLRSFSSDVDTVESSNDSHCPWLSRTRFIVTKPRHQSQPLANTKRRILDRYCELDADASVTPKAQTCPQLTGIDLRFVSDEVTMVRFQLPTWTLESSNVLARVYICSPEHSPSYHRLDTSLHHSLPLSNTKRRIFNRYCELDAGSRFAFFLLWNYGTVQVSDLDDRWFKRLEHEWLSRTRSIVTPLDTSLHHSQNIKVVR